MPPALCQRQPVVYFFHRPPQPFPLALLAEGMFCGITVTDLFPCPDFVKEYCQSADKNDVDEMYEIRSKLFHSGEFSFFEFDISMNPYLNPIFEHLSEKYTEYRKIIRKTIINWIVRNVMNQRDNS